jgi:putative flippase GtrA
MPIVSRIVGYCVAHFTELWRFGLVGILTFGVNFLSFSLFFALLHAGYQLAVSLAYVVTLCFHFLLNKIFTFGAATQKFHRNLLRYAAMLGLNYVIVIAASWITVEVVGASPYWTAVTSTAGTALSSFFVMKYFVFGARVSS